MSTGQYKQTGDPDALGVTEFDVTHRAQSLPLQRTATSPRYPAKLPWMPNHPAAIEWRGGWRPHRSRRRGQPAHPVFRCNPEQLVEQAKGLRQSWPGYAGGNFFLAAWRIPALPPVRRRTIAGMVTFGDTVRTPLDENPSPIPAPPFPIAPPTSVVRRPQDIDLLAASTPNWYRWSTLVF
jgi:hypothetical protein